MSIAENIAYVAKIGPSNLSGAGKEWPATRFVLDPSGKCLSDNLTGLMWPKNGIVGFKAEPTGAPIIQPNYANTTGDLNYLAWEFANDAMNKLNAAPTKLCGYSDWRLPNIVELKSLVNYDTKLAADWLMYGSGSTSSGPICSGACFSNVLQGNGYWSSSTSASNPGTAWTVDFSNGVVVAYDKPNPNYVWPVRGGR